MTRFTKLMLAAALGGTVLGGAAYAAQDQAAPPAPTAGMHHHRHGHGDMLAKLDANHDGVITRDEAIAAATARFDRLDTNHDGKIDQTEIAAAKAQMQQRRQAMRAKWQQRHAASADQSNGQ